nr:unnamed protein product [Callosobruchus analis]
MEGRPLAESPSIKLLGISINNNMSWHDHVATIAKTASQNHGAQIRPSLEYCSHVWGCAPKHSLKLLNSIQNRAVKLIDTDNLTKDLHSLEHRRRVAGLSLFYRFYHGRCSSELSQIITPKAVRTGNTRDALHAHPYQVEVPTPRTSLLQHSFFWKTSRLWNELPGSLFPDGYNLQRFKTNLSAMGKRSRSSSESSSGGVNTKRVLKELNYLKKKLKRLEKRDKYDRFVDDGGQDDRPPSVAASSKSNARPERRRHRAPPCCHGTRHRPLYVPCMGRQGT